MNQLYYSKGYRITRIEGLFCVTGYSRNRIQSNFKQEKDKACRIKATSKVIKKGK
jgi:hypothetical protein